MKWPQPRNMELNGNMAISERISSRNMVVSLEDMQLQYSSKDMWYNTKPECHLGAPGVKGDAGHPGVVAGAPSQMPSQLLNVMRQIGSSSNCHLGAPGVEGDAGHPGVVARAPGHAAARLQAVDRHQVVLPPCSDEPPVWAPRAAQQPAVVALQEAAPMSTNISEFCRSRSACFPRPQQLRRLLGPTSTCPLPSRCGVHLPLQALQAVPTPSATSWRQCIRACLTWHAKAI